MTGWGQHIDDLAAAAASLLQADVVGAAAMTDTRGALACRDAVVAQLRELVGAVSDVPRLEPAPDWPMAVVDVTRRPGQALHRALAELPRSTEFGITDTNFHFEQHLPPYEQLWRDAARACVGLEGYVDAVGQLPAEQAWLVLRDLADLAAAVPMLDHGLSELLLPWLERAQDLAGSYALLTHPAHDAVRVCATEVRARVLPAGPSTGTTVPLPTVMGAGELDIAMGGYLRTVLDRAGTLSIGDVRAVCRLLECGGTDAVAVLHRSATAVPGAFLAAQSLREVAPWAARLRGAPAKSLGPEHLDVLRDSGHLQRRLRAVAIHEQRLAGGAADIELRRLARPALEFARHVPDLTRALELGVRQALADKLMLIPSEPDRRSKVNLRWVTVSMEGRSWVNTPPVVQQQATALAAAGERVGPGVRAAQGELTRREQVADRASTAAAAARAHAGAARAQLRAVLGQQLTDRPAPLGSALPAHPRLAPDGPGSGRGR